MDDPGMMLMHEAEGDGWLYFSKPVGQIVARRPGELAGALEHLMAATEGGAWAAGWLAYEAASGLDPHLHTRPPEPALPVAWFGLYRPPERLAVLPEPETVRYSLAPWRASLTLEAYTARLARIQELIAAGETHQVNFTFPLRSRFEGDPYALFHALDGAQRGRHHAFILTSRHTIVSVSPELFFTQDGDCVTTRPLKGTRPRGRWAEEDDALAAELAASAPDRAENLMIVDVLRGDLGRLAAHDSVQVARLFDVERFETVLQMTSTVEARIAGHPLETLRALFPCGSVTGAPKIHTMKLIAELEDGPRGVYSGAIGWLAPSRRACFSVAVRTMQIDHRTGEAVFGVGSGVSGDADPAAKYEECLTKARLLEGRRPSFDLFETMRWEPDKGILRFDRHLERLASSARYFHFACDRSAICSRLHEWSAELPAAPMRVEMRLTPCGQVHLESAPVESRDPREGPLSVALAVLPVVSDYVFLYHQTTRREVHKRARAARPGVDDVLLWNERGELTESTQANLVVELDGRRWTPPRTSGLLAGALRGELLESGEIAERLLRPEDLARAENLWLINSVTGWTPARLAE